MRKEYVSLILERDGRVLVERRRSDKKLHPCAIVFPSGKIEPGETKEQAIIREMEEELGITIKDPIMVYQEDSDIQEMQRIYWFMCKSYSGEIKTLEAAELMWIKPEEAGILTFDISRRALKAYMEQINTTF